MRARTGPSLIISCKISKAAGPLFRGALRGARRRAICASRLELIRMPVNLSIKNAPDEIVVRLKKRAAKNHRSLQGEMLAIIEEAVREPTTLTPREVLAEVRRLGLQTPAEAVAIIRAHRDGR